jgi:hypothetical protein
MGLNRSYSFEKMATDTLFKEVRYTLGGLINGISMGQIGLPDI